VVGFRWRNPVTRRRERGVFKVLKPHIAACYAEDMKVLGQLARYLARKHHASGTKLGRLAETLTEIRLLLEREVDFPREQSTLLNDLDEYRALPGIRIPHLIPALSTATITAQSFEQGRKVTEIRTLPNKLRLDVAEKLAKTLLAVPALSRERDSIFHADPHAGNLLYDRRTNELVILDWALTERLTRKQRKNIVLLVLMLMLRDADGMAKAVEELCQVRGAEDQSQARNIREHVDRTLDELPLTDVPGPMHAMRLLDKIALEGVRFPAALLMFRKASFTLEGVVEDAAGSRVRLDLLVGNYALAQWKDTVTGLFSLLSTREWAALEWSALTFSSRMCTQALLRPFHWLPSLLTKVDAA
jgi:ubiquinone biosynthesis protein